MTDRAAIAAQVVDIQNDRQHKGFIKVTLHVPAEHGAQLTAAMGWPTYTEPVPVALARLAIKQESEVVPSDGAQASRREQPLDNLPASGPDIPARAHRPVDADKRLAQRAGILCNDPLFQRYLTKRHGPELAPFAGSGMADVAADFVRRFCRVESRADIKPNTEAATRLDLLESAFVCWRDAPELADA